MTRLGQTGLFLVMLLAFPPLTGAMVFSKPILQTWIGPDLVGNWGWQSAMFVVPVLTVMVGFGGNALLGRVGAAGHLNRLTAIQLGIQFSVALSLLHVFSERAFILGQVLAVILTFPWQIELIRREQRISRTIYRWMGLHGGITVGLAACVFASSPNITNLAELGFALLAWQVGYLLCAWVVVLKTEQRNRVISGVRQFMKR